jgi:hexosaminidase
MRYVFASILFVLLLSAIQFAQTDDISIIPKPHSVIRGEGTFVLARSTQIQVQKSYDRPLAKRLHDQIFAETGLKLKIISGFSRRPNRIQIASSDDVFVIRGQEYQLDVRMDQIELYSASHNGGLFSGIQTLVQLIRRSETGEYSLPVVKIDDSSRFPYRGMHLDVARHFMPLEFVKRYIDLMAQYKFNYFHWHLTDDQGWRIEIKKYPKLTEVGSIRSETHLGAYTTTFKGDGIPHGGFYTQKQIREVVAYAKEPYITVIPEIELPGHASAALAAYPQFGCKTNHEYKVQTTWGIFKEVFCPTEETFKFLEDVLDEVITLFPDSPYIHIGGDEVLKDHWRESEFVQELKKREGLKDENEVQAYFIRRIERHLNKRGKKMVGWDEILDGGLAPNATVMSWRGMRGGIEAARAGHDVIMSPTDFAYFDYGQGDPAYEPVGQGYYLPLSKVYSFEPVPAELTAAEAKHVIGGQANVWTEYMKTPSHVEYMAFPRMLALSEVLWSPKEDRDYADFQRRLWAHLPRLDRQDVNYRIPEPGGLQNVVTETEKASLRLQPATGTRVHFTTDGSTPDERSPSYTRPIEMRLGVGEIKTLKTIVINAAGRKSVVYAATVVRGKMREPDETTATTPGLSYSFLVPNDNPNLKSVVETGETRSTSLNQFAQRKDLNKPFTLTLDGYFRVPEDGVYEFQVDSTWDATVVLGDSKIIDDAGTKDRKIRSAIVPLKAGLHKMALRYNHRGGESSFRFRWGIKGLGLTQAWGGEFVH